MNLLKFLQVISIVMMLYFLACKKDKPNPSDVNAFPLSSFTTPDESISGGYVIQKTLDENYVIIGGGDDRSIKFLKINDLCDTLWVRTFKEGLYHAGFDVKETNDGGYILTGYLAAVAGNPDIYLLKTDHEGNKEWFEHYEGVNNEQGRAVIQVSDNGYIVAGYEGQLDNLGYDIYLIRTDEDGQHLWSQTLGSTFINQGFDLIETAMDSDQFLILGTSISTDGTAHKELILTKIDFNGAELWTKKIGKISESTFVSKISAANDNGFILVSSTADLSFGNDHDILVIKIDSEGNELWSQTYGGNKSESGKNIKKVNGGGYIILGTTLSSGNGFVDIILIRTDNEGNEIWTKTYGGSDYDSAEGIIETDDGGFIICGATKGAVNDMDFDLIILKVDSEGNPQQ